MNYDELKRLADEVEKSGFCAPEAYDDDRRYSMNELCWPEYLKQTHPCHVKAIIEEKERLERFIAEYSKSFDRLKAVNFDLNLGKQAADEEISRLKAENEAMRKDAERYRYVSQLAWYVDRAAYVYNIGNSQSPWAGERAPVDADDVEEAIDDAMSEEALHD